MPLKILDGCDLGAGCRKLGINTLRITDLKNNKTYTVNACAYCTEKAEADERLTVRHLD